MVKEKNWLIRTSNFQILGPVSKDKIIEFVNKGSLKGDDEITSGNGYWFHIKEEDLLEKYILGDIPQTFNPITEAPNILTANNSDSTGTHNKIDRSALSPVAKKDESDASLPDAGDLEYPDMNLPASDDLEYPDLAAPSGELSLDALDVTPAPAPAAGSRPVQKVKSADDEEDGLLPEDSDLEYPDMGELLEAMSNETEPLDADEFNDETDPGINPQELLNNESKIEITPEPAARKAAKSAANERITAHKAAAAPTSKRTKPAVTKTNKESKPQRNDKLLFVLTTFFFIALLLAAVIFYYKKVLNKPLPFIGQSVIQMIIPSANAQTAVVESLVKKKTFLILKK